jgi:hypothetical protein
VGTATELDVLYRGFAPHAVRIDMMELDEGPLVAASPALAHERAGAVVTERRAAPDLGRDVAAAGSRAATRPRRLRRRELLLGQVFEQRRQRPIDDLRQISGGDGVAEQVLRQA